jgi:signal transduction histidine kinase/ligand-binding sensor domain-containing protein/FixJ family two-component response regulator
MVTSLAVEPLGENGWALWIATENGVARLEDGRFRSWGTDDGLPHAVVQRVSVGPVIDGARSVWAGTNGGLARFRDGVWTVVDTSDTLSDPVIRDVLETVSPEGVVTLWVGTIRRGLARWRDGRWTVFSAESGAASNEVSSLFESDRPGAPPTLWVGYNGGGIARLDEGRWLTFDQRSGLPSQNVLSFGETVDDDGGRSIWFGTRAGLAHYKGERWTVYDSSNGLPGLGIRCILQTSGVGGRRELWVGTSNGLARLDSGRWTVLDKSKGRPGDEILSLCEAEAPDGRHVLWVSTGSGIAVLDGDRVTTTYTTGSGLPHNRVQCVAQFETRGVKSMWAATDEGVARLDGDNWLIYTTADGLANNVAISLTPDERDGHRYLWAGTFGGVSRFDLDDPDGPIRTLTDASRPALPNNTVYQVRRDAAGRLYVYTNKGVARLTPREPTDDDPSDYAVYTFTTADGLPANECDIGASFVDRRGRVWVGTVKGVAMLDPARLPEDTAPKPLRVERVLVNDEPRWPDASAPFGYDENDLVFEYALLSFFRGASSTYRTELVGLDDGPTTWSSDTKRVCTNLPAGAYELRVWGKDYAGNVSGPVSVAFRIRPAPWQTWWAYALYAVAAAGVGYGLTRYRLDSLRRQNEQLEARIRERTAELAEKVDLLRASEQKALEASRAKSTFLANMSHELRTPLNAILGFVQLMERSPGRSHDDREQLSIIGRSGEHLLSLINDVLSLSKIEAGQLTLNERAFDLPGLLGNVEEMFRLRAQAKGLQLIVDFDPDLPRFVHGDDGKLRQILINLLGNAFKFTDSGGVAMRVRWADGVCDFEVEDTGHGIAPEEMQRLFEAFVQTKTGVSSNEGTGLGLAISRNYIQLMGGDIHVASEEGHGTRFTFNVPFAVATEPDAAQEELRVVGLMTNQPTYRVIVADDKWENRRLLARLLADVGFQVREAADGGEAVRIWDDWRADIVWMDIQMPNVDGYEATRRIRALERDDPSPDGRRACILAVTASAFAHDREAIIEAGCDDYVPKPFRNAMIFEKMAEHVGVRFVYSRADRDPSGAPTDESVVTGSRLLALPADLVADLNRAVVQGDVGLALHVCEAIEAHDERLGAELRSLVRAYRFDEILDVVGKPQSS